MLIPHGDRKPEEIRELEKGNPEVGGGEERERESIRSRVGGAQRIARQSVVDGGRQGRLAERVNGPTAGCP